MRTRPEANTKKCAGCGKKNLEEEVDEEKHWVLYLWP
jgi:hypothetical protein